MKPMKNYCEDDFMSRLMFVYLAFIHASVGYLFIFGDVSEVNHNAFSAMSELLSNQTWGLILLAAAVSYLTVAIQENKTKHLGMLLGGFLGAIVFGFLTMAMIELDTPQFNTARYGVLASLNLIISVVGGLSLWRTTEKENQEGL